MRSTMSALSRMRTSGPAKVVLLILILAIPAACVVWRPARAQQPEPRRGQPDDGEKKASVWMKQKLGASRNILEGMTSGDYQQIEKNARSMQLVGYLEKWARADVPGYKAQLFAFDHANEAIVRAAQNKNLDGVTLAYAQLMISCVQCHAFVRDGPK